MMVRDHECMIVKDREPFCMIVKDHELTIIIK